METFEPDVNAMTCQQLTSAVQQEPQATQAMSTASDMPNQTLPHHQTEAASGLKSGFLADMSHEIRNPINAIIGMAHLALRTDLDLRQQDYLNKIHRAGLSLLGLINDILDFSKIEAGKLEMEAVPFLLDDVLNNVASVTSQRAAEKQLEYWFNMAPDVPAHFIGDPIRLAQVLINLVNHAIKFTDQGEIELAIKLVSPANAAGATSLPPPAPGQSIRLEIAVRDSGGEMTPARQEKLFLPFGRADGSPVRNQGGSGLGLSISQQLVHLMGSTLAIRDAGGQGSTCYFELELALPATTSMPAIVPGALTTGRILLVDDNPQALQAMANMLQALSLRVSTAPSGIAALRAMIAADQAHDPYSLVLTDWHMPKMTGIELRKRLAERPAMIEGSLPAMPRVVLLAGFGREEELPDLEQAGFAAMWCKPMSQSCLLNNLCALYAEEAESNAGGTSPAISFAGASVLLAEDNEINQQIVLELLGTVEILVDIANTGVEAVEKLLAAGEHGYSAILMDLEMPEMNGHQATLRIRSEKRFDNLPIIAMTAHTMAEVREQCTREGMQDYLTKPIHPEHLFQTLARWIKRH